MKTRASPSEMMFGASQFSCPPGCRKAGDLYDVIDYTRDLSADIPGRHIFWGPYVELDPGIYLFTLRGSLDGEITVEFACNEGAACLKSVTIGDLRQPICLTLLHPVKDLELRGVKANGLAALRLTALSITCAYRVPGDAE